MAEPRSGPYIWATWLSRLLVGDYSCEWAAWFKAHYTRYDRMPGNFDAVTWQMDHTALLNSVRDELEAAGTTVFTENQGYFNLRGQSGTVIGGKPDLVAVGPDRTGTIYDVKTGQPRASDTAQVMIYMYALPYQGQFRGMRFDGRIVYREGRTVDIPSGSVNDDFKENLFALIRRIAASEPARRVPSALECGFCDLTPTDCSERIDLSVRDDIAEGGAF